MYFPEHSVLNITSAPFIQPVNSKRGRSATNYVVEREEMRAIAGRMGDGEEKDECVEP